MNIIDIALLILLGVSVAFAFYRGFLASLLGMAACVLSLFVALAADPSLADALSRNQGVTGMLATYTDAESLIGDYDLAKTPVMGISDETMENILRSVSLPQDIQDLLRQNMRTRAFESRGQYTINAYVSGTIVSVLLRVGSFLLCFFACFLALHMLINLISHVFYFPVLRHLDGPMAALMGVGRGLVVVAVLLVLIPAIRTVIPLDMMDEYIGQSKLISLLYSEKLLLRVIGLG